MIRTIETQAAFLEAHRKINESIWSAVRATMDETGNLPTILNLLNRSIALTLDELGRDVSQDVGGADRSATGQPGASVDPFEPHPGEEKCPECGNRLTISWVDGQPECVNCCNIKETPELRAELRQQERENRPKELRPRGSRVIR